MKAPCNILIPMAGRGQRFIDAGYKEPKPFIDVLGKPMIEHVVDSLGGPDAGNYIFVVSDQKQVYKLHKIVPGCTIVVARETTAGAACTALLAKPWIDNDERLLIANCDQIVSPVVIHSSEAANGGVIWTFPSDNPKWSYAATDHNGRVWAVAEKQVISRHATCGLYMFDKGAHFVKYAQWMIERNVRVNGEFYIAPVFNEMIAADYGMGVWARPVKQMIGLGTPEDLKAYEDSQRPAVRP